MDQKNRYFSEAC